MNLKDLKQGDIIKINTHLSFCYHEDVSLMEHGAFPTSFVLGPRLLMFEAFVQSTFGTIIKFIDIENCKYVYCWWDSRSVTYVLNCVIDIFDLLVE